MIEIEVRVVGALIRPTGKGRLLVSCSDGTTVAGLLERLGYRPAHARYVQVAVNGELRRHDAPLADGDRVVLSLTVGGG